MFCSELAWVQWSDRRQVPTVPLHLPAQPSMRFPESRKLTLLGKSLSVWPTQRVVELGRRRQSLTLTIDWQQSLMGGRLLRRSPQSVSVRLSLFEVTRRPVQSLIMCWLRGQCMVSAEVSVPSRTQHLWQNCTLEASRLKCPTPVLSGTRLELKSCRAMPSIDWQLWWLPQQLVSDTSAVMLAELTRTVWLHLVTVSELPPRTVQRLVSIIRRRVLQGVVLITVPVLLMVPLSRCAETSSRCPTVSSTGTCLKWSLVELSAVTVEQGRRIRLQSVVRSWQPLGPRGLVVCRCPQMLRVLGQCRVKTRVRLRNRRHYPPAALSWQVWWVSLIVLLGAEHTLPAVTLQQVGVQAELVWTVLARHLCVWIALRKTAPRPTFLAQS